LSNPDGQFINVVGKLIVLINQKLKESPERYFVIAHELYHAVEHSDLAGYYVSNDKFRGKLEREANKFAATLILRYHIDNVGNSPYSLEKFRKVYGVCEDMADYLISQIKN
ncbi:ImmA/IrrE family metallo-endopeptidase, partial [Jeotgalibaca porci]|uniref:ImmA/IrrE family metallo-endopeptidase n=1 Tax=Jeotgalibaca porci TaxID=1868793 RepID=UPI00359F9EBC